MSKIQWQSIFEVGVPEIDAQHRNLVSMINKLEDALTAGKGLVNEEIGTVLIQLVDYTQTHFADEERIQEEIHYSDRVAHAEMHRKLVSQVKAILLKLKKGGTVNVFEMMNFLRDWLVNHILKEDRRIGVEWRQHQKVLAR